MALLTDDPAQLERFESSGFTASFRAQEEMIVSKYLGVASPSNELRGALYDDSKHEGENAWLATGEGLKWTPDFGPPLVLRFCRLQS